jgi:hypothetical protein
MEGKGKRVLGMEVRMAWTALQALPEALKSVLRCSLWCLADLQNENITH